MWRLLKPFGNNLGMKSINTGKYLQGSTVGNNEIVRQSHAQFAFLLDYVPNWKFAYKPGGLIQFQTFIPYASAEEVFTEQLLLSQKFGIIPYLGVFKRHQPDQFLMTHAVDGFSFALDYPVTDQNREGLATLTRIMTKLAVDAGGRHYFAKDSMLTLAAARSYLGDDVIAKFTDLKNQTDPTHLLQTDLSKRLFNAFS
jgi:decaprenylphospho-beta-D-ribofuranose 2-oxidase